MKRHMLSAAQHQQLTAAAALLRAADRNFFLFDAVRALTALDRPATNEDVVIVIERLVGVVPFDMRPLRAGANKEQHRHDVQP